MYCVKCGVGLADTEKKCPLCGTAVYHPDIERSELPPSYPVGRIVKLQAKSKAVNGLFIVLFLIPLLICFLSDLHFDRELDWFGFAAGGLLVGYITLALPNWFQKPNPVIFIPCDFAAAALYLLYISFATNGSWFLPFALPLTAASMFLIGLMSNPSLLAVETAFNIASVRSLTEKVSTYALSSHPFQCVPNTVARRSSFPFPGGVSSDRTSI